MILYIYNYQGTFGEDCRYTCNDCRNGACSTMGDGCICEAGWTGIKCDHKCPGDTWGKELVKIQ